MKEAPMVSKLLEFFRSSSFARDPVCHMRVDIRNAPGGATELDGVTYYFCAKGCRLAFEENPTAYLSG